MERLLQKIEFSEIPHPDKVFMSIDDARIIELPRIQDPRGNLTFVQNTDQLPFDFKRIYYLYDVPGGESRGGHAHKNLHQFIIAASGSFDIVLNDGEKEVRHFLNRSYYGLYIPNMIWRDITNFSSGSILLALVSELYDEQDYHRDYDQFLKAKMAGKT